MAVAPSIRDVGRMVGSLVALAAISLLAGTTSAGPASAGSAPPHRCLVVAGAGDQPFGRNFNPFGGPVDFTSGGIYEPLVIVDAAGGGRRYDWLASGFHWSGDRRTLTLDVRRGVRWTDGTPLTSRDVVYTLTAGRQDRVMDQIGLTRRGNEVVSVRPAGRYAVAIRLDRVDTTFVSTVLANHVHVVPEHVFAHVKNVGGWLNPHPVGTGPFAVVRQFGSQSYTLGRNPHYWQPGRPRFPCIERVLASSSESALLQLVDNQVDLSNDLFPNARKAYVAHDPAHFHYFYPARSPAVGLFFDDTVYPYSLVAFRKAISLAIDRNALSQFAEYGYAPTADATGINRAWPAWISKAAAKQAARMAAYDPPAARRLLLGAGFTYRRGSLIDPRGAPVVIDAIVMATWVDWYTDWQLIAKELGRIGIDVKVDAVPDIGAWIAAAFSTRKATLLWSTAGDTDSPYTFFKEHLDAASFIPSGRDAERTGNWAHFQNASATRLLARFRQTSDPTLQHRIAAELEQVWLRTLPYVPLFAGPTWSTYSTRYFVGFPNARDDYIEPDFTGDGYVVALTRIRPRRP